jgi:hypothetical protein
MCIATRTSDVNILIPIAKREFFGISEFGISMIKRRVIVTQLANQEVSRVKTDRKNEMVLQMITLDDLTMIRINFKNKQSKII